jgi:uncharacterized heparinase superfamily protein
MNPLLNNGSRKQQQLIKWRKRLHVQRYLRLLLRLIRMRPAEIAYRLNLVLFKKREIYTPQFDGLPQTSSNSSPQALHQSLGRQFDELFFFGPNIRVEASGVINKNFPLLARQLVAMAKNLGGDGIDILGQKVRILVDEIDWQADPKTSRRAWSQQSLDEAEAIGSVEADVKYVWEVNRHQFMTILGRAFWLTDDPRYARQAAELIDDWIAQNPPGEGINWSSHLEVAMRAISWLWTLAYLLAWPQLNEDFLKRWLSSLADHYAHLSHNLSIFTDPTNHLIGEATALWMLSVCLPDLPESSAQADRALSILSIEVERQITPDGVNKEQSTSYHRFVLDFYLQVLALARRRDLQLPMVLQQRVIAMLGFVSALAGKSGQAPMIGDSDDARGIPMLELVGWGFQDLLSTGAALFARPEWKAHCGGFAEASYWLLGSAGLQQFNDLTATETEQPPRIFPEGGYCFFDIQSPDLDAELIFDVGPLGLWPNAAHGHADALSIQVRIDGNFLLTDPGTGTYFSSPSTRDALRATASHNTLTVDGLDQADIFDTFKWVNPPNVSLLESFSDEDFYFAVGMHDGYLRLRRSVNHFRYVLCVRSGEWIIVDYLEGEGNHLYTRHFNFHPNIEIKKHDDQSITAVDKASGKGVMLAFPAMDSTGNQEIYIDYDGRWSKEYGHCISAPYLRIESRGEPAMALFTFITPMLSDFDFHSTFMSMKYALKEFPDRKIFLCTRHGSFLDDKSTETIAINPTNQELLIPSGLRSDANFLFLQKLKNDVINKAFIAGERRNLSGPNFHLQSTAGKFASYNRYRSF